MKSIACTICLIGLALGFSVYGDFRILAETVHFDSRTFFRSLTLGILIPLILVTPLLGIFCMRWMPLALRVICFSVIAFAAVYVGLAHPAVVLGAFLLAALTYFSRRPNPWGAVARLVVPSLIVGAIFSEVLLLRDDAKFEREVAENPSRPYARDRSWPSRDAALVYDPESGVHATD